MDRFQAVGFTDAGCERDSNEDCLLICSSGDLSGYFVFDGMGGQPAGEAAAMISADAIRDFLRSSDERDLTELIKEAIETAQQAVLSRTNDSNLSGMGTTVVGVLKSKAELALGAVGDSRAYHIKLDSIEQITNDHTLVQQLVDAGKISQSDAMVHPQSHILTRCLGSELGFAVDSKSYFIEFADNLQEPAEWILLCSDGLYGLVSDEEMAAVVTNMGAAEAATRLIEIARARGGFDNITALIVPVKGRLIEKPGRKSKGKGERWSMDGDAELHRESSFTPVDVPKVASKKEWARHIWRVGVIGVLSAVATIVAYFFLNFRWG
jgi:protein phosphatase